ncbi:MAG TPA: hypothetical protein VI612_03270 [Candidatus Nanoarchaeia archaeon]|nr:hypothetical protein [Candidatus Nanoarchaeia archaeon]
MKILQKITLVMIYLIISLPIVFAQELNLNKFSGKDGANGYARSVDEITVETIVSIPGEDIISPEQLRLYLGETFTFFDSCTKQANSAYYTCVFKSDMETYAPMNFKIEMRDDDGAVVAQQSFTIQPDIQAPAVKTFNIEPPTSNGAVTISYNAEDYGTTYGDPEDCSGIKTITVKSGNDVLLTEAGTLGQCVKESTVPVSIAKTGRQNVCITAKDFVNREDAPTCVSIIVDKSPPDIRSTVILDQENFPITHVHAGEERLASINAIITDDGEVDVSSVFGNFAQLNPNLPDAIQPDVISGDLYSWANIPVSEVKTCKISVKATDTLGNTATKEFSCVIKADDTVPIVKGIISHAEKNGTPLYGYGTNLVIEFEEKDNTGGPGIGMGSVKAYLDMSSLGMGDHAQADDCQQISGAIWQCYWMMNPPASIKEGQYNVALTSDSQDDLGNTIDVRQEYDIIYDNVGPAKPEIVDFKVVTGQAGVEYKGGAVRGNFVQYTVKSADFSTAEANFTEIGGIAAMQATSCTETECIFESLVDLSGPYTSYLTFNFYDEAKNKASDTTKLEIYGVDNETKAKYWTTPEITCTPRLIDRETSMIVAPRAACRLSLSTPRKDITTLTVVGPPTPQDCTGDVTDNLNDVYMVNNGEGSINPYLFFVFEPKDYTVDQLNINCSLQVYSKRAVTTAGTTRYYVSPQPQSIDANVTFQFYNQPLANAYTRVDRDIRHAMDNSLAKASWLGQLNKVLYYFEVACQMKVVLTNVIGVLYALAILLGIAKEAVEKSPYTAATPALKKAKEAVCGFEENLQDAYAGDYVGTLMEVFDSICAIANCQLKQGKRWVGSFGSEKMDTSQNPDAWKGGYAPYCDDIQQYFSDTYGGEFQDFAEKYKTQPLDIKDSLILSTICLCLPGIISNVEKMRQIQCFKAVCLHDYVKQQGYPTSFCNQMYNYFWCTYVAGEIFALVPFSAFFEDLLQKSINIVTDPVGAAFTGLGMLVGGICKEQCKGEIPWWGLALCGLTRTVSIIGEAIGAWNQYITNKDIWEPVGTQYCDRMEDIEDEMSV